MGYRSTYNRRLRSAKRLKTRLGVIALLSVAACSAAALMLRAPTPEQSDKVAAADAASTPRAAQSDTVAAADTAPASAAARRIYPYSIVPGGVAGRDEVVHVLQTDRVVARHYAGLQVARLSAVTVREPRAVYVSYRKGDKVFWTSKKVMLAQGETLLSDGSNEIRTRCGNRVSDVPRLPTEANEPSAQVLDTAMNMSADVPDDQHPVSTASSDAEASTSPVGFVAGSGAAPTLAHAPVALAMLDSAGVSGSVVPAIRTAASQPLSTPIIQAAQSGAASDSSTPSGTPGTSTDDGAGADGGSSGLPGNGGTSGTGGGTSGTGGGTPGTGGGTPGTSGTPTMPTTPAPGTGGTPGTEVPPLPGSLSQPGSLPGDSGKTPPASKPLPEPDSLWLSGIALAAMLLRRKPRKRRQG